jgi:MarR family transcriptional regulator, organic hydroperoxide resistance regulator
MARGSAAIGLDFPRSTIENATVVNAIFGQTLHCSKGPVMADRTTSNPQPSRRFDSSGRLSYNRSGSDSAQDVALARHSRLDLSDFFPYLINRVGSALVARFSAEALDGKHLSIAMWRVLAALSNDGGLRQIDVADMTSIEVSTLSRLITRLVQNGLVSRTRSTTNSREVTVQLSPKGKALVAQLIPIAEALQDTATQGLSKQEMAVVKRALKRMHQNLTHQGS